MKRQYLLLIAILFTSVTCAFAQNKVEKYVQVLVGSKNWILYTHKSVAKISFGANKELFSLKDTTIFQQLKLVDNLTTEIDVLNYMGRLGWTLVNIHSISNIWEVLYFKKAFDTSEFIQDNKSVY